MSNTWLSLKDYSKSYLSNNTGAEVGEVVEWHDRVVTVDFQLEAGWSKRQSMRVGVDIGDDIFVIQSVEGELLGPMDRHVLTTIQVELLVGSRSEFAVPASLITPHDSALEARVKRMESLLDGLLAMNGASDDPAMQRLAEGMQRLGWKPYDVVDQRRLAAPCAVRELDDIEVVVDATSMPQQAPVPFRVILRGAGKRPVA